MIYRKSQTLFPQEFPSPEQFSLEVSIPSPSRPYPVPIVISPENFP